jgi:hypothetical protein
MMPLSMQGIGSICRTLPEHETERPKAKHVHREASLYDLITHLNLQLAMTKSPS